ncbi:MAG: RIP metalloprotease RseP [Candidatus Firestonebacteria bacterium]
MGSISGVITIILGLGFVVFIHELGHFLAARVRGVKVTKFSLGMGPKLWGFKKGDTEYMLSWIPIGGYVKMAGDEPAEEIGNQLKAKGIFEKDEFLGQVWWGKIFIIACGPLMNLFLAIAVFIFVFWWGMELGTFQSVLSGVEKGSAAEISGFKSMDKIISVDGAPAGWWHEFAAQLEKKKTSAVIVERAGKQKSLKLEIQDGKAFGFIPYRPAVIEVNVGAPAYNSGFKDGDLIVKAGGKDIKQFSDLYGVIQASKGKEMIFELRRSGQAVIKKVKPLKDNILSGGYVIGVSAKVEKYYKQSLPFGEAFISGFERAYFLSTLQLKGLWMIITNKQPAKDSLGGPIMIAQMAHEQAKKGFTTFLLFFAYINLILGVLNLFLPIPVLDSGAIIMYAFEGVLRRPINLKVQMGLMYAGWVLVILLMVFATYNDIAKTILRGLNK